VGEVPIPRADSWPNMRGWSALSEKWRAVSKKSPKFHPIKKYVLIGVSGSFFDKNNEKHILEAIGQR
jgi:hypothetical protein